MYGAPRLGRGRVNPRQGIPSPSWRPQGSGPRRTGPPHSGVKRKSTARGNPRPAYPAMVRKRSDPVLRRRLGNLSPVGPKGLVAQAPFVTPSEVRTQMHPPTATCRWGDRTSEDMPHRSRVYPTVLPGDLPPTCQRAKAAHWTYGRGQVAWRRCWHPQRNPTMASEKCCGPC